MKKFFYLPLLFVTAFSAAQAQTAQPVSGKIADGTQKGIESATVSLLAAKDSAVLKINVADKEGNFRFENVLDGKYLISATAVGYQLAYSEVFEKSIPAVTLKTIQLQPASTALS